MSFMVSIKYDGEWDGHIATSNGSFSIDGTGDWYTTLHDVDRGSVIVSKCDDSNKRLTLKLYTNNKLIFEGSTTAKFGVVTN